MVKIYKFEGHSNYRKYQPEIRELVLSASNDSELRFYFAINEAVCNAARYARAGHRNAPICIKLKLEPYSMSAIIIGETVSFDANGYLGKMQELAAGKYKDMDWGDYTHDSIGGRGFFYMLEACDFVTISSNGNIVTLHTPLPIDTEMRSRTKIWQLVSRLRVSDIGQIGAMVT